MTDHSSDIATESEEFQTLKLCTNLRAGDRLPSCGQKNAKAFGDALRAALDRKDIGFDLKTSHCMGHCHLGPTLRFIPAGPFLLGVQVDDIPFIIDHLERRDYAPLIEKFGKKEL